MPPQWSRRLWVGAVRREGGIWATSHLSCGAEGGVAGTRGPGPDGEPGFRPLAFTDGVTGEVKVGLKHPLRNRTQLCLPLSKLLHA